LNHTAQLDDTAYLLPGDELITTCTYDTTKVGSNLIDIVHTCLRL
jgi:hypothetical protein